MKQRIQKFGVHSVGMMVEAMDAGKMIRKKCMLRGQKRKENGEKVDEKEEGLGTVSWVRCSRF